LGLLGTAHTDGRDDSHIVLDVRVKRSPKLEMRELLVCPQAPALNAQGEFYEYDGYNTVFPE
jgi:hypothetical protein